MQHQSLMSWCPALCVTARGIHNILHVGRMEAATWGQSVIKVWQQQNCTFCGEMLNSLASQKKKIKNLKPVELRNLR